MNPFSQLYGRSMALLTDLYQLTMAYGYWKLGLANREAVFQLSFRKQPFAGGFSIACGLQYVTGFLESLQFTDDDVTYLAGLKGNDGRALFEAAFLQMLRSMEFECDIDAMPEGTVVFPHEPLLRVTGPILQCQILETPLLNMVNFQTLIATKAARVCLAAQGDAVLEFGLRRAQGVDGALAASRAAYVGGCAATSNVMAGRLFDIPVRGTHAHSWVMLFDDETEAFESYASVMPNNCVFLVDTFDTLEGVRAAAHVGQTLKQRGHKMVGVRLDSGDLAYLSIEARRILDESGLQDAVIIASNDLDEQIISSVKQQGATVAVWGVGTKLITAHDQPAIGGVYKLAAVKNSDGVWQDKVKLSEQSLKVSIPGMLQVRRYHEADAHLADMIYDERSPPSGETTIVDPLDATRRKTFAADRPWDDLLVPVFRHGKQVYDQPSLPTIRRRTTDQLGRFHEGARRLVNPHQYPVGIEASLHETRTRLIMEARDRTRRK